MARYFKNPTIDSNTNEYWAVAASDADFEDRARYFPAGKITTYKRPEKFISHWDTKTEYDQANPFDRISQATGLSHQFVKHLLDTVRYSNDPTERELERAINTTAQPNVSRNTQRAAAQIINEHPLTQKDTLFTHVPEEIEISGAKFDKRARYLFPTTASIIRQEHPSAKLIPSENLSIHSSHVVNNAISKGLLPDADMDEPYKATNDIDFETLVTSKLMTDSMVPIPERTVQDARLSLKQFFGRNKKPKEIAPQNAPEHPTLPLPSDSSFKW